ncbi:hypothetical protein AAZX31_13G033900 [Glycine max]|nr:hypothetical protein GLYMA_13G047350v4 [Glycine max]KAH1099869.1 hypothetical protein GYH30_035154 [Glycine max]
MFQIVAPQITIFTSLALFLKVAPTCCKNCMDAVSVTKSRLQRDTPQGQISLEGRRWSNVLHIRS